MVRVRVELTTLALSAPRSADWANGPAIFKVAEFLVLIIEFSRGFGVSFHHPGDIIPVSLGWPDLKKEKKTDLSALRRLRKEKVK